MLDNRGEASNGHSRDTGNKTNKNCTNTHTHTHTHTHTKTQTLKKIRNIDPIENIILRIWYSPQERVDIT